MMFVRREVRASWEDVLLGPEVLNMGILEVRAQGRSLCLWQQMQLLWHVTSAVVCHVGLAYNPPFGSHAQYAMFGGA